MAAFGKDLMSKEFMLDSNCAFLNHGSYGSAPTSVLDYRISLIKEMERQPDIWFRDTVDSKWAENIDAVSDFLGSKPENLLFVQNTTTGVNSVLKSLKFSEGDGMLLYSWTYGAVKNTCRYISDTKGVQIFYVDLPLPIESMKQLLDKYEEMLVRHPSIKIVIIDYISSMPPILMPVVELITLCKKYNKLVIIDGAHSPGQVQLNLETLGADFYSGNLHKWAYAPRGCAVLWMHPDHHGRVFPVVTSRYFPDNNERNFSYQGTGDMTQFYSAKEALKFYQSVGGYEVISAYNTSLVTRAADMLVQKWNTEHFPIPFEMQAPYMRMVRIPLLKRYPPNQSPPDDMLGIQHTMHEGFFNDDPRISARKNVDIATLTSDVWNRFKVQAVFVTVDNKPWVRISVNIYSVMEDYEKLADAILALQSEEATESHNGRASPV